MARPIVLVHGYSSEGRSPATANQITTASIRQIYGTLVEALVAAGYDVATINVGRYLSLDDGVTLEDVSFALERALTEERPDLRDGEFDVIIHSTGALVVRNWIRRYTSPGQCPVKHLIHLAGANFGSGWAHIGSAQAARILRGFLGTGRGKRVLEGLELGSSWAIDLHHHFLQSGQEMLKDYKVYEFCIIGTQAPPEYLLAPVRYGKEDGSDGVVRVSAGNLNVNYMRLVPNDLARSLDHEAVAKLAGQVLRRDLTAVPASSDPAFYSVIEDIRPDDPKKPPQGSIVETRPQIPFAIPYQTSHGDMKKRTSIVSGSENRTVIMELIRVAVNVNNDAQYRAAADQFDQVTDEAYTRMTERDHKKGLLRGFGQAIKRALHSPEAQYDPHSQLVFRLRDQHGQPVRDFNINLNSRGGSGANPRVSVNQLMQDTHKNRVFGNSIAFYLRTALAAERSGSEWKSRVAEVEGVTLEIDGVEPDSTRIQFLPLRFNLPTEELVAWLQPHRTTVIDVELYRLPTQETFVLRRANQP